jgi:signal transduction histidine kinase
MVSAVTRARVRDGLLGATVLIGCVGTVGSVRSGDLPGNGDSWTLAVSYTGFAFLGWAVSRRRPDLPIGWLLIAGGAVGAVAFLATWWAEDTLVRDPGALPGGSVTAWLAVWTAPLPWPLTLVAPLVLFPAGRPRSRRWWWFGVIAVSVILALSFGAAVCGAPAASERPVELLDLPGSASSGLASAAIGLQAVARLTAFAATVIGVVGLAVARRGAMAVERRQYSTVLAGAGFVVAVFVLSAVVPALSGGRFGLPEFVTVLALLALPASIAVAVVRFQLYEVQAFVNRSVLVVATGTLLVVAYLVLLVGLAALFDVSRPITLPSMLAAGAVVVISTPMARLARRLARRRFGRAPAPTSIVTRFAEQVGVQDDPVAALSLLAESMREELRLGSIEMRVEGFDTPIVLGEASGPRTLVDLRYGQRQVGHLRVTARAGETLAGVDLRALADVAGYVSIAAEAIRVSADLRRAQEAIQNAHSEERRRVRADLHDDVGPTLASARLKLAAHRRHLPEPAVLDPILDQVSDAIHQIRRVVDGLQPSILEDVGLVPAVQVLVNDLQQSSDIDFTVHAPPQLPELTAAAAGTAYRVIAESLANVVRHSRATTCALTITQQDDQLSIQITDDGCGFDPAPSTGMGLRNMNLRAQSAHGALTVTSSPAAGTTVALEIPA